MLGRLTTITLLAPAKVRSDTIPAKAAAAAGTCEKSPVAAANRASLPPPHTVYRVSGSATPPTSAR